MTEPVTDRTVFLVAMALGLGGAETHVVTLAKGLNARGLTVLVGSAGGPLTQELTSVGIRHILLPLGSRSPIHLLTAQRMLQQVVQKEGVDLVHAHARIPAFVADNALRGRVPLVTTAHSTYRSGLFWRVFTRFGDHAIAVSADIATYIREHLGAHGPISVIPNGIDTQKFSPLRSGEHVRRLYGIGPGPVILHMSRYVTRGIDLPGTVSTALALMDLFPALSHTFPTLQILLVGDGLLADEVRARADGVNRLLGRTAVIYVGGQPKTPEFFAAADIVVGVGRTALEGMSTGKPTVIAGEGGILGYCSPKTISLLRSNNFTARSSTNRQIREGLLEVLVNLLKHPALCKEIGDYGRQVVETRYSGDHMVDEVLRVYLSV